MFKLSNFNLKEIEKYKNDFITYRGHLPYLILAVLSYEDIKKRNDYLNSISPTTYDTEIELLKSERRNDTEKVEALKKFLIDNFEFIDIIQK